MSDSNLPKPEKTSRFVAQKYFGVVDEASRASAIRQSLVSIVWFTVLIPALFYLRFREVGPLGWGTTIFFDVYSILTAVGLYFANRTEFHTPVKLIGDWLDRIGAFWLVGCAFGPFFGWILTTGIIPVTANSWRWLYAGRVFLAAGIPLLLALPMTRYIRGKSSLVSAPILIFVTLLPISSAMNVTLDLWEGPALPRESPSSKPVLYLAHTEKRLGS